MKYHRYLQKNIIVWMVIMAIISCLLPVQIKAESVPIISKSDRDQIFEILNNIKRLVEKNGVQVLENYLPNQLSGQLDGTRIWKKREIMKQTEDILFVVPEKLYFELETPHADVYLLIGGQLGYIQHWNLSFTWAGGTWKIKDIRFDRPNMFGFNSNRVTYTSYPGNGLSFQFDSMKITCKAGTLTTVKAGKKWVGLLFKGKGNYQFSTNDMAEKNYIRNNKNKTFLKGNFTRFFMWAYPGKIGKILSTEAFKSLKPVSSDEFLSDAEELFGKRLKELSELGIQPITSRFIQDPVFENNRWFILESTRNKVILDIETWDMDWLTYILDPAGYLSDKLAGWTEEVAFVKRSRSILGTNRRLEIISLFNKETDRKYMNASELEWEDNKKIRIEHYKIQLTCTGGNNIECLTNVTFKAKTARLKLAKFRLLDTLVVDSVIDKQNRRYFVFRTGSTVNIPLLDPLRSGESLELKIKYHGDAVKEYGNRQYSLLTSAPWVPQNGYLVTQPVELEVKVPKPFVVASLGTLAKTWEDGRYNVSLWRELEPVTVPGLVFGEYSQTRYIHQSIFELELDGYMTELTYNMLATSQSFPGMDATNISPISESAEYIDKSPGTILSNCGEIIRFYNNLFGQYRYSKFAITHLPFRIDYRDGLVSLYGQGLPSVESRSIPSLVILEEDAMRSAAQKARLDYEEEDAIRAFESRAAASGRIISQSYDSPIQMNTYDFIQVNNLPLLLAREIAKQWWGNSVTWKNYHDLWLGESIAEFCSALYVQNTSGNKDFDQILTTWKQYADNYDKIGPLWMGPDRLGQHYVELARFKGAYIHHMLRMMFPKGAYFTALKEIYKEFEGHPITTYAFKNKLEKTLYKTPGVGRKYFLEKFGSHTLDWFFEQWIMRNGIPKYKFKYETEKTPDGYIAHCTITPKTKGFIVPLRLWVHYKDGNKESFVILMGDDQKKISLEGLPSRPKKLVLNQYKEILCNVN